MAANLPLARPVARVWSLRLHAAVLAGLLVLPKLALVRFTERALWCHYGVSDRLFVVAQDLAVAVIVYLGLVRLLRRFGWVRAALAISLSGFLLLLLMLDGRVRELWLRPSDLALIRYGLDNSSALTSGADLFFRVTTGWSMTLRRALTVVLFVHAAIGVAFVIRVRRVGGIAAGDRWGGVGVMCLLLALLLAAVFARPYRYHVEHNIFLRHAISPLQKGTSGETDLNVLAKTFEQTPVPLQRTFASQPRRFLTSIRPFRNALIVFLESVRWEGMGFEGDKTPTMPNLYNLAKQGILARSRVPIPHSCKSDYAVLTGRYPYPDIEARESFTPRFPSVLEELRVARKAQTYAFSGVPLAFENLDGLLSAAGVQERTGVEDLAKREGVSCTAGSSFGGCDDVLYALASARIKRAGGPFAAVLLPVNAHYPYVYPHKPASEGDSFSAYTKSIAYSDLLLAGLIDQLRRDQLLEDTLVVFVGDHGESFGEHGVLVHNSSIYDVEVTAPLIFWSADGRLRHDGVIEARHIDVAPTIADLFDLYDSQLPVQGTSLLRQPSPEPVYLSAFFDGVQLGLVEHSKKYILFPGEERLAEFDLTIDPHEKNGHIVTNQAEFARIATRLHAFRAYQRLWKMLE